jgi:hypothetical protein
MSNYENIEYIIKKRQDNINNKKMWFDGLSSDAFALSNADDKRGAVMLQNTNKDLLKMMTKKIILI